MLKEPQRTHAAPGNPDPCGTCLGCKTESSVESTSKVSGSPTISERISRRRGSRKRLSLLTLRGNEEGCNPTTTGEQVRKEPLCVAQERALALYSPQLLEEGEGDDFRVCEPL